MSDALFLCHLRAARCKARVAATAEALALLRDLNADAPPGGPLSEKGGVFWVTLPGDALKPAIARLPRLGYTYAVDLLEPVPEQRLHSVRSRGVQTDRVRWHHKLYQPVRVYEEDAGSMQEQAPDQRTFLLETKEGEVRAIRGYRGDGGPLSRRGLAVYDARLLVNLVFAGEGTHFLDPFAGVGGIVIEALASGYSVVSADWDPALRHGLSHLGARHYVADARSLPFSGETFDAIATEPPYSEDARHLVIEALCEVHRILKIGGRLAILCAAAQADDLLREGISLGLRLYLDSPIDRKGLGVVVLAWQKER